MATKYTYDPVKAAQVSSLIKSGIDEEEAFKRAGIPEAAYGAYALDAVPGSPTEGQVIKNFGGTVTVYSEEEEKAIADAGARRAADEQSARDLRNKEIADEREKNLERIKREREAEKEAAKKGWVEEETKAETAGPTDTRTTSSVVVTGGAERVTKMTPEMSDWTDKKNTAYKQDQAATDAAREDFYRSKGLEGASRGEKLKALTTARNSGEFTDVTTAQDAVGEPPRTQYTTETIRPNATGEQTPNDGTQTPDQAAKNSAAGQTAEAAVTNDNPPPSAGTGNVDSDPNAQPLDDKESAKVAAATNGQTATEVEKSQNTTAPTTNATSSPPDPNSNSNTPTSATNDSQKDLSTLPASAYTNKLHNFTGYTYRITLFLLTQEDFKSISDNPASFDPKHALISSGGGYATPSQTTRTPTMMGGFQETTTPGRHPDFLEDFFIENLAFTSTVGLNAKSKASNSFGITFNIIEPYGMTLLDRLLSACETTAKCTNYIEQPYLLQVDFLSNVSEAFKTDPNKPSGILIDRKRFPIRFSELKIKPSTGGTEYRCSALPYNHTALSQSKAVLPINMAIEAKTVGDFFDADTSLDLVFKGPGQVNPDRIESEITKWIQSRPYGYSSPSVAEIEAKRTELKSSLVSGKSLPNAYNNYMKSISTEGKLFRSSPNLIAFNIDSVFKNSPLTDPDITEVDNQPMTPALAGIVVTTAGYVNPDYKTKQIYNLHAGSDIVTVIDRIMQSSKYIKDQVLDTKKAVEESQQAASNSGSATRKDDSVLNKYKFLDWYKIIPQVRLLGFDSTRNAYSTQSIFNVVPYRTANPYHPDFKKTKIPKGKLSRSYKYLYTGLNTDIISLDIDFDTAFYTQLTSFQNNKQRDGSNYTSGPFADPVQVRDGEGTSRVMDPPMTFNAVGSEQQAASTVNRGKDPKDQAVASLVKSVSPGGRGDMLNIRVRIVGDPGFIKQDDIYYNPMSPDYKTFTRGISNQNEQAPINSDTGQILFDQEQVYVQLITRSAVDINDATGITNKQIKLSNGRTTDSTFSGVYKVQSVKSELSRGKFEQTLELIKMPNDMLIEDIPATSTAITGIITIPPSSPPTPPTAPPPPPPPPIANSPDPNLKEAGNGPITNPTSSNSGQGASSTGDQPSAAAPGNVNDTNTAPQEKAQTSQTDSVVSLSELQARLNTVAADPMGDKFTSDTTPETARANGQGEFWIQLAEVNQQTVAARALPTEKERLEERIRIRTAFAEYFSNTAGTLRDSVISPMLDIKPHPRDFSTSVLNFTQTLRAYNTQNNERLASYQTKLSQLK